jgi:hypothetical protein
MPLQPGIHPRQAEYLQGHMVKFKHCRLSRDITKLPTAGSGDGPAVDDTNSLSHILRNIPRNICPDIVMCFLSLEIR